MVQWKLRCWLRGSIHLQGRQLCQNNFCLPSVKESTLKRISVRIIVKRISRKSNNRKNTDHSQPTNGTNRKSKHISTNTQTLQTNKKQSNNQQTPDVCTTSNQLRCNVMTLYRRWCDVVSTLRASWEAWWSRYQTATLAPEKEDMTRK